MISLPEKSITHIGEALVRYCHDKGVTRNALANRLGIDRTALYLLMRGERSKASAWQRWIDALPDDVAEYVIQSEIDHLQDRLEEIAARKALIKRLIPAELRREMSDVVSDIKSLLATGKY